MKKVSLNRKGLFLKFTAATVAAMIVISTVAMIQVMVNAGPENEIEPIFFPPVYQTRPCEVSYVLSQAGLWVSFDSPASTPGTPAKAHVTVSDTSGITIVADFHGFWRSNHLDNTIVYDDLQMPGASSMKVPGIPILPSLFEYVEIPRDVDVSIKVLASSSDTLSGYNIGPAPVQDIPFAVGQSHLIDSTILIEPTFFNPLYSNNAFFPGDTTSTEGEQSSSSLIMRGHRLLGLNFYPVQYNPFTSELKVYSQIVVRVKYSVPAQIQPVAEHLRSDVFEGILRDSLLNYDPIHSPYFPPGQPREYSRVPAPPPAIPSPTIPQFLESSDTTDQPEGAEYLIITTNTFKSQADRLAEWKEQKGIPSAVWTIPKGTSQEDVKSVIAYTYNNWDPAPTYVLLMGDVEDIPTNYDAEAGLLSQTPPERLFQDVSAEHGSIASDLGYFNIQGNGYLPDMIYSRISVDTEMQAEIIVNKTLQYEQSPPAVPSFYNSILSAGYFQDRDPIDGEEDEGYPFLSALERIRHYLNDSMHGYNVHINYSCAYLHYDRLRDGYVSSKNLGIDLDDL
ncbi:MAG: C25 family cysteine peptidase, partial [Candidatus Thorarchaeota archaeon]